MPSIEPYRDESLPGRFLNWIETVRDILRPIPQFLELAGTPEGVITAEKGTRYFRTDGPPFLYYKSTDGGNTGWLAYGGATVSGLGLWRYRTETTSTPATGRLQFDNAVIDSATNLYVNVTNDGGVDMSAFLALVVSGDQLYIQVAADSSQFVVCQVGLPALLAGVYTFPLTAVEGQGTTPSQNTQVALVT